MEKNKIKRKPNPGFMAFQKVKKHISEKLEIPNSVVAGQIGSSIINVIKEKEPSLDPNARSSKAMEDFDNNMAKYKKLAEKYKKENENKKRLKKQKGGGDDNVEPEKKVKKKRKPSPGFMAFQKLKKHISVTLEIPNSVIPAQVGGNVLEVVKKDDKDMDSVKAAELAIEEFDNNEDKYRKLAAKYKKEKENKKK